MKKRKHGKKGEGAAREPMERRETVRQELLVLLSQGRPVSAKQISVLVSVTEKEVVTHLEHIGKTLEKTGRRLHIEPARCRRCGFEFIKRSRLKKPSRCPVCRAESIDEPLFSIE